VNWLIGALYSPELDAAVATVVVRSMIIKRKPWTYVSSLSSFATSQPMHEGAGLAKATADTSGELIVPRFRQAA